VPGLLKDGKIVPFTASIVRPVVDEKVPPEPTKFTILEMSVEQKGEA
jgi:hypothetical protein